MNFEIKICMRSHSCSGKLFLGIICLCLHCQILSFPTQTSVFPYCWENGLSCSSPRRPGSEIERELYVPEKGKNSFVYNYKKSGNFVAPKSTSSSEFSSLEAWSKMTHFIYLFILLFHILSIVSPRSSPLSPLTLLSASPISFFKQETEEEYLFTYSFNQLEGPIM